MSKPVASDDVAIAWSRMMQAAGPSATPGFTPRTRLDLEKPPVSSSDRRRRRFTGRTRQLNTKVTPEFDAELRALAKHNAIGIAEMLERILAGWKAANA
jgi:hypothetical protein